MRGASLSGAGAVFLRQREPRGVFLRQNREGQRRRSGTHGWRYSDNLSSAVYGVHDRARRGRAYKVSGRSLCKCSKFVIRARDGDEGQRSS